MDFQSEESSTISTRERSPRRFAHDVRFPSSPPFQGRGKGVGWRLKRLDAAEEASSWASSPFVSNPPLSPSLEREGKQRLNPPHGHSPHLRDARRCPPADF